MVWIGISTAVFGGVLVPLMTRTMKYSGDKYPSLVTDANKQNETALLAMTLLGLGEIFGGQFIGQIRDRKGNKAATLAQICLLLCAIALFVLFN